MANANDKMNISLSIADIAVIINALDLAEGNTGHWRVDNAVMHLQERLAKEANLDPYMDVEETVKLVAEAKEDSGVDREVVRHELLANGSVHPLDDQLRQKLFSQI